VVDVARPAVADPTAPLIEDTEEAMAGEGREAVLPSGTVTLLLADVEGSELAVEATERAD
jgi:hypothetical protein